MLIPSSKPPLADTPPQEEDNLEDLQVEEEEEEEVHREDLEVRVAIHPEHQDLLH